MLYLLWMQFIHLTLIKHIYAPLGKDEFLSAFFKSSKEFFHSDRTFRRKQNDCVWGAHLDTKSMISKSDTETHRTLDFVKQLCRLSVSLDKGRREVKNPIFSSANMHFHKIFLTDSPSPTWLGNLKFRQWKQYLEYYWCNNQLIMVNH